MCVSLWKLYLKVRLKTKKIRHVFEFNQWQWSKSNIEFSTQKVIEAEQNNGKDEKGLNNAWMNE